MHTGSYLHQTSYREDDNNTLHPRRSAVLLKTLSTLTDSESVPVKRLVEEDGDHAVVVLQKGSKQSCDLPETSILDNKESIKK